jgi:Kef-type K+ transport system membrane component KefB
MLTLFLSLSFVAIMILGVRRVLPQWLGNEQMAHEEPSSGTLAIVVCVVIAGALCTEIIGIHALFGAFLAGAIMPDTEGFRRKVRARVERFSSVLLLPLFFAFTGLRTQVGLLDDLNGWLLCLLIIVIATVGKLGASAVAARLSGMNWRESLQPRPPKKSPKVQPWCDSLPSLPYSIYLPHSIYIEFYIKSAPGPVPGLSPSRHAC